MPVLFHWSPVDRRDSISRRGLVPRSPATCSTIVEDIHNDPEVAEEYRQLAVCLGTSPSHAWHLSGYLYTEGSPEWDLWQVVLDDEDFVIPLPFEGFRLAEIRVANRIPKKRVWYVATRTVVGHERRRRRP